MLCLQVLGTFCALYMHREGLSRTSDLAKDVLLYVFHGFYWFTYRERKTKNVIRNLKPIVHFIHNRSKNGRSRFKRRAKTHFSRFVKYVETSDRDRILSFLADKGVGEPPVEYLAAIEEGLRKFAADVFAMGTGALRSKSYWHLKVAKWRKREAYIAIARVVLGLGDYCQWDCASFADYINRLALAATFERRHYPLSDGQDHFEGLITYPPQFQPDFQPPADSPVAKKRVKREINVDEAAAAAAAASAPAPDVEGVMVWDVDAECFVKM